MRRNNLGNPKVRARAKLARRLDNALKQILETYVLNNAKGQSSEAVADKFDIRVKPLLCKLAGRAVNRI